ncbi:MAG TPA: hypothetical protein VE288_14065 [Rubrobacteraceae bacterium]|nr:hypothetical protein [Rubrobacteraceae bacterium]
MAAVAERFVGGLAAAAQSSSGSAVGSLAVGTLDLDLPTEDERAVHCGDYPELWTFHWEFRCKSVLAQDTGISEIHSFVVIVAEGFVHGFATATQSDASVF